MSDAERTYVIAAVTFDDGKTTVRVEIPKQGNEKYCATLCFPVTAEHGRALSQYIGEEVQLFALPVITTFEKVVSYKLRVKL